MIPKAIPQKHPEEPPLVGSSAASLVAKTLRDEIIRGEFKEDERLRQDHLAVRFGVSQMIVREAFKQLVHEGFLQAEPRRGVAVSRLSQDDVVELTHVRSLIEAQALAWAIPKMTAHDLEEAARVLKELERAETADGVINLNKAFHRQLYAPCARPRTLALVATMQGAFERYFYFIYSKTKHVPKTQREHHAILKLCRDRNVDAACDLLKEHIMGAGEALTNHLARFEK